MQQVEIGKLKVYPITDKEEFLDFIASQKKVVISGDAKKLVMNNQKYTDTINQHIIFPDGKGLVQALRRHNYSSVKYPGYLMWKDLVGRYQKDKTFYFLGASPDVIKETVEKVGVDFPDARVLGYRDGYFKPEEKEDIKKELKALKPDIVFVAYIFPKQEMLCAELHAAHEATYIGLGGSFDVYTDRVKPVPVWWEKYVGYESLYRLMKDPKKYKRQFLNLKFFLLYHLRRI